MNLLRFLALILFALCGLANAPARAQGVIPIALSQVMNINGQPLPGALLYIYQAGTVATFQNAFSDPGLSLPLSNPLVADQFGRLPMFYLANGSVHVRLTDPNGLVLFDYPSMLVIGASGGSSSGGTVDPTSIASTGDVKFRPTSETLSGWVKINGLTLGSATSGATGRANADTQTLFVYLWNNCTNAHCAVIGGRGATGLADFNANKQITLPDWRARMPVGLDDMGRTAAGILQAANVTSPGDTTTTPGATGGEANHTVTLAQLPAAPPAGSIGGTQAFTSVARQLGPGDNIQAAAGGSFQFSTLTVSGSSFTLPNLGSGGTMNVMNTFMLGTWFMKL